MENLTEDLLNTNDEFLQKKANKSLIYGVISVCGGLFIVPLVPIPFAILGILSGNKGKLSIYRRRAIVGLVFSWIGLVLSVCFLLLVIVRLNNDTVNNVTIDTETSIQEEMSKSKVLLNLPDGMGQPIHRYANSSGYEGFLAISDDYQNIAYYASARSPRKSEPLESRQESRQFLLVNNIEIPFEVDESVLGQQTKWRPFFTTDNTLVYVLSQEIVGSDLGSDFGKHFKHFVVAGSSKYGPYDWIGAVAMSPDDKGFQFVAGRDKSILWVTNGIENEISNLTNDGEQPFEYKGGVKVSAGRHIGLPLENGNLQYYVIDGKPEEKKYQSVDQYAYINGHHVYCGGELPEKKLVAVQDGIEYPLTWDESFRKPDFDTCYQFAVDNNQEAIESEYTVRKEAGRFKILHNDKEVLSYDDREYSVSKSTVSLDGSRTAFILKRLHTGQYSKPIFGNEKQELAEYSVLVLDAKGEIDTNLTTGYTNLSEDSFGIIRDIVFSPNNNRIGYFVKKVDPNNNWDYEVRAVIDGKEIDGTIRSTRGTKFFMTFSADSQHYAFAFSVDENVVFEKKKSIVVLNGRKVSRSPDAVYVSEFSTDGKLIIIYAQDNKVMYEEILP